MTDMSLLEVLQQPNFEIDHASIDVTVPQGEFIEHRCYMAESIPELKFNIEAVFKCVDNVLIGVHGKLNGEYKCYVCFVDKAQFLSNEEWKQIPAFKKTETGLLKRIWNWLRGKL